MAPGENLKVLLRRTVVIQAAAQLCVFFSFTLSLSSNEASLLYFTHTYMGVGGGVSGCVCGKYCVTTSIIKQLLCTFLRLTEGWGRRRGLRAYPSSREEEEEGTVVVAMTNCLLKG